MSSPSGVVVGLLTDPTFGVPMIVLVAAAIGWALWSRPASPPALAPYRYRRAWMDAAELGVSASLGRGYFRPAVAYLYTRLMTLLASRYSFPVERFNALFGPRSFRGIPAAETILPLVARFREVYRRLAAAEGPSSGGFWTAILRPGRRRRLRASVERLLPEYDRTVAALEAGQ